MRRSRSALGISSLRPGGISGGRLRAAAIVSAAAVLCACSGQPSPEPLDEAFAARGTVELYAELAPNAAIVAAAALGERLEIVGRRRRFVRVRTASGAEGWTQQAKLITPEARDLAEQLREQTASYPDQGAIRALQVLNVHLEPYRWSTTIYQLQEDEEAQLLRHRLVERLPHAPVSGKPAPAPTGLDDWYLIRMPGGQTGWVLTTGTYSAIPDEVKQFADRKRISFYAALAEVEDTARNVTKKTWLWTQIDRPKRPHDFDRIRVFMWSRRRGVYETISFQSGQIGYLPVEIHPQMETPRGTGTGFSVLLERKGKRVRRTYVLIENRVHRVGEEQGPRLDPPIRLVRAAPEAQPPTALERLLSWWK